jgi:hypothetical protein
VPVAMTRSSVGARPATGPGVVIALGDAVARVAPRTGLTCFAAVYLLATYFFAAPAVHLLYCQKYGEDVCKCWYRTPPSTATLISVGLDGRNFSPSWRQLCSSLR